MLHEISHIAGFISGYSGFDRHVQTTVDGSKLFVGPDFVATLSADEDHLDPVIHFNDLMNATLAISTRKLPTEVDAKSSPPRRADGFLVPSPVPSMDGRTVLPDNGAASIQDFSVAGDGAESPPDIFEVASPGADAGSSLVELALELINADALWNIQPYMEVGKRSALHAALQEDIANGAFDHDMSSLGFAWDARGDVSVSAGQLELAEDGLLTSGISQAFIVPAHATQLQFTIERAAFVPESSSPPDAFEVALLDAHAMTPLVGTAVGLTGTDSLLNIQATGQAYFGSEVTVPGTSVSGDLLSSLETPLTIVIDVSGIPAGTEAVLYFDLLGFGSVESTITIDNVLFSGGNTPPIASAGGPYEIVEGDDLVLNASGSIRRRWRSVDLRLGCQQRWRLHRRHRSHANALMEPARESRHP